ncbi:MAG: Eco57I restriction-modification methylase domain-containing protein [Myxococcales bacterium]|nr:Eco57I restriction-modification methylase domain-containing protein [Myxococcales bacterium]
MARRRPAGGRRGARGRRPPRRRALGAPARTLFEPPGFDWPAAFPAVFAADRGAPGQSGWPGGFDVVVGNPPYRAGRRAGLDAEAARARFASAEYQVDPYVLFLERGLDLLRPGGRLAFVVPNSWLSNHRAGRLRAHLLRHAQLTAVVEVPADTFAASVETIVLHAVAGGPTTGDVPVRALDGAPAGRLLVDADRPEAPLPLARDDAAAALVRAAARWTTTLGDVCEITRGINPYHRLTHTPEQIAARVHHADAPRGPDWRPELRGRDLRGPLHLRWGGRRFVHYGPWLKEPRKPRFFEGPRVLVRKVLGQRLHAAFVTDPWLCDQSIYVARLRPGCPWPGAALAALLSSTLMATLVRARHQEDDLIFPQLKVRELRGLPLPPVAPDDARVGALDALATALQRRADGPDAADLAALDAQVEALYGAPSI